MDEETISNAPAELTDVEAKAKYRQARREFAADVLRARRVSRGASGIRSETDQHYWASVLFTRMVVTATSIQVLTPEPRPDAHWDFSAMAYITRNFAECYLFFYFLCADNVSQVEKGARIILLNLHDNASRKKLFGEVGEPGDGKTTAANAEVTFFGPSREAAEGANQRGEDALRARRCSRAHQYGQDERSGSCIVCSVITRTLVRWPSIGWPSMAWSWVLESLTIPFIWALRLTSPDDLMRRATADFLAFFPDAETGGRAIEAAEAKAWQRQVELSGVPKGAEPEAPEFRRMPAAWSSFRPVTQRSIARSVHAVRQASIFVPGRGW